MSENGAQEQPAAETPPAEAIPTPTPRPSPVIDRVLLAYSSRRKSITVAEFDGLTLYFGQFTSADLDGVEFQMRELHGTDTEKWPKNEFRVRQIVHKAELEDGSVAFLGGDVVHLMTRVPIGVITKLYLTLLSAGLRGEDAAGKSEGTPDSGSA